MRTVSRYLLREFALASSAVLVGLVLTWIAADTLLHVERLTGELRTALRETLLGSLEVIPVGVPMACLAGAVWSLTRAVKGREITAIRCGGIPLKRTLVPIVLSCVAVAAGLVLIQDRLLIPTRRALHEAQLAEESGGNLPKLIHDRWWYAEGNLIFSARNFDRGGQLLIDVTIFLLDGAGRIERRIEAEAAANTQGRTWDFRFARVFDFAPDGTLQQRTEERMTLDLGLAGTDLSRADPPLELATLNSLRRSLRRPGADPATRAPLQVAFHSRLAQPAAVLILVLLAIPFAIGDTERGDSLARALVLSLGCAALYWTLWALSLLVGRAGVVPGFVPLWTVAGAGLAIGGWRFHKLQQ